jgi:hypothetical protein
LAVQDVPDANKPETWQFQVMPTWLADGKTHEGGAKGLAELKEIAAHLTEPWKSSLLWIPDDTDVTYSSVSYWPTIEWDSQHGTLTLAGDSAHPVPPHRGQGEFSLCESGKERLLVNDKQDSTTALQTRITSSRL